MRTEVFDRGRLICYNKNRCFSAKRQSFGKSAELVDGIGLENRSPLSSVRSYKSLKIRGAGTSQADVAEAASVSRQFQRRFQAP